MGAAESQPVRCCISRKPEEAEREDVVLCRRPCVPSARETHTGPKRTQGVSRAEALCAFRGPSGAEVASRTPADAVDMPQDVAGAVLLFSDMSAPEDGLEESDAWGEDSSTEGKRWLGPLDPHPAAGQSLCSTSRTWQVLLRHAQNLSETMSNDLQALKRLNRISSLTALDRHQDLTCSPALSGLTKSSAGIDLHDSSSGSVTSTSAASTESASESDMPPPPSCNIAPRDAALALCAQPVSTESARHPSDAATSRPQDEGAQDLRQDLNKLREELKKLRADIELAETPRLRTPALHETMFL